MHRGSRRFIMIMSAFLLLLSPGSGCKGPSRAEQAVEEQETAAGDEEPAEGSLEAAPPESEKRIDDSFVEKRRKMALEKVVKDVSIHRISPEMKESMKAFDGCITREMEKQGLKGDTCDPRCEECKPVYEKCKKEHGITVGALDVGKPTCPGDPNTQ